MTSLVKHVGLSLASGVTLAIALGALSTYNDVQANTRQNEIDKQYNVMLHEMKETLIRVDENVKILKELKGK